MNNLKNIFIIDDSSIYHFMMLHKLKLLGFDEEVKAFLDGEEALDFLNQNLDDTHLLPDLIFLDINMPVMSGFDFLEEFAEIKPKIDKEITIYVVSSSVDDVDIERAKNNEHVHSYIIKPFQMEDLKSILKEFQQENQAST
ncbi:response regulator receiver domain-containing protein [Leeuwenhoekiella aestuarii]|uniref:Response regulator receiver domain-containing protein n=1 Tax=Leeuwenhoekiella aestuarii TaxID=2249426 RepID=A0A4Q0NRP2_9FLAO|nr:response regulator [Leeuwenhoekiella aestuarii]RXG13306.1 response regulator receiver domain-containing protein [Leeuwenhoekiella aestuarii]RXG14963.1 response regulator receiver domain-containing protein [Leeuwenhoekiella aestuarii]